MRGQLVGFISFANWEYANPTLSLASEVYAALAKPFNIHSWFYDVASESGTCETPRNMPAEELPDDIRRIKAKCRINRY